MAKFGDIYIAKVYFKGQAGQSKRRPVLIVDDSEDNLFTIAEITSVEPNDPPKTYDLFKIDIPDWKVAGLDRQSWVKCHKSNIHRVPRNRLINFVGEVGERTMLDILDRIYEE